MIDCYVTVTATTGKDQRFPTMVFEGHVGLSDDLSPAWLARELEDMAFRWGYDSDDIEIHVIEQEPDFDWIIPGKAWLEVTASEILQSSGDLAPKEG